MSDNSLKLMIEALFDMRAAEAVKLADEKREPVADAASVMWGFGYGSGWLKHASPETILGSAVEINRSKNFYLQLEKPPVLKVESFGVIMNGELYEPNGDGWSFRKKYPDREKTADAAQYLWRNQALGDWDEFLVRKDPEYILKTASGRQEALCTKVADNAWIAFDEGGYRDVLQTLGSERIRDYADQAKARRVRKNSTIQLTAAEVSSGLDRVKWAEALIKQLPEDHDGRNSWLMNYGEEAAEPVETVELKIYTLRNGDFGADLLIRFYDAKGSEVFERVRKGHVKYSVQHPFIDRFDVPGGYSFYTASVVGECCYTVERVAK